MTDETADSDSSSTDTSQRPHVRPYQQEDTLRDLYHGRGLSQSEVAERFDVTQQCISIWMDRHDIEPRSQDAAISKSTREDGKVQYLVPTPRDEDGRDTVYRHQLVALLAEDVGGGWAYEPSDVFGENTHCHHEMNSPVGVDLPENLAVLDASEHLQLHGGGYTSQVEGVLGEIFEGYNGEPELRPADFEDFEEAIDSERAYRLKASRYGAAGD